MATKADRNKVADELEQALDAYEAKPAGERELTPEADRVHDAVRTGLKTVGDNAEDVMTLRARGFINGDWSKAVRTLIEELRA